MQSYTASPRWFDKNNQIWVTSEYNYSEAVKSGEHRVNEERKYSNALKTQLSTANSELSSAKWYKDQYPSIQTALTNERANAAELKGKLVASEILCSEKQEKNQALEQQLEIKHTTCTTLTEQLAEAQSEASTTHLQLQTCQSELSAQKEKHHEYKCSAEQLASEVDVLKQQMLVLKKQHRKELRKLDATHKIDVVDRMEQIKALLMSVITLNSASTNTATSLASSEEDSQ